jgi:hypothetical protein
VSCLRRQPLLRNHHRSGKSSGDAPLVLKSRKFE